MKSRPELAMEFLQDGEEWQDYKEGRLLTLSKADGQLRIRVFDIASKHNCQKVFTQYEVDQSRGFQLDYQIEQLWERVRAAGE